MSLVLVWRTREFYRGDIYARFRDAAVAADESPGGGSSVPEQRPDHGGGAAGCSGVNGGQRGGYLGV